MKRNLYGKYQKSAGAGLGQNSRNRSIQLPTELFPYIKSEWFYFVELTVENVVRRYENMLADIWVYEDVAVQGFVMVKGEEIVKLFVEPALQNNGTGAKLLEYAKQQGGRCLWALEKNTDAIRFYLRHGFKLTGDKKLEEDTTEYLVKLEI